MAREESYVASPLARAEMALAVASVSNEHFQSAWLSWDSEVKPHTNNGGPNVLVKQSILNLRVRHRGSVQDDPRKMCVTWYPYSGRVLLEGLHYGLSEGSGVSIDERSFEVWNMW